MEKGTVIRTAATVEVGDTVEIKAADFEALLAWSPRPGSAYTVEAKGESFRARLVELHEDRASLFVFERMPGAAESPVEIVLLQALPSRERMELIIEKATELGVDMIVPFRAEKGIDLEERESSQKKAHKWPDRAKKAAKQCRRARIPTIAPFMSMEEAMRFAEDADMKIMLLESAGRHLKDLLKGAGKSLKVCILSGPEGGFAEDEVALARDHGFVPVSLGARILRTETAAIVGAALVQYELGDLGGMKRA